MTKNGIKSGLEQSKIISIPTNGEPHSTIVKLSMLLGSVPESEHEELLSELARLIAYKNGVSSRDKHTNGKGILPNGYKPNPNGNGVHPDHRYRISVESSIIKGELLYVETGRLTLVYGHRTPDDGIEKHLRLYGADDKDIGRVLAVKRGEILSYSRATTRRRE